MSYISNRMHVCKVDVLYMLDINHCRFCRLMHPIVIRGKNV